MSPNPIPTLQSLDDIFLQTNRFLLSIRSSRHRAFDPGTANDKTITQCHQAMSEKITYLKSHGASDALVCGWAHQILESINQIDGDDFYHQEHIVNAFQSRTKNAPEFLTNYQNLYQPLIEKSKLGEQIVAATQNPEASTPTSGQYKI